MRKITKKEKETMSGGFEIPDDFQKRLEELINKAYGLPSIPMPFKNLLPSDAELEKLKSEYEKQMEEEFSKNNTVSTFSNSVPANITQEDIEKWKNEAKEKLKKFTSWSYNNLYQGNYWKSNLYVDFFESPESTFPEPNYDIIPSYNPMTGQQKEYWLPALKVLNWDENLGWFVSPSRPAIWANDELEAEFTDINYLDDYIKNYCPNYYSDVHLQFLNPSTDWGIYGGLELSEIFNFLTVTNLTDLWTDPAYGLDAKRLCIVEPSPDADVVICEQGWRAKKAFISEIVGETIDVDTVSNLLSIAWNRKIDVRGLYENWKDNQSNSISEA